MTEVKEIPAENQIDEQAISWGCRLDQGLLDSASQAELDTWLAADPRHRGAFVRAQAAWKVLDRLSSPPAEEEPARNKAIARRRILIAGASIAALAAAAAWLAIIPSQQQEIEQYRISTPRGEIRTVNLNDGSRVIANTDSQLEIAIRVGSRAVDLKHGEAWFEVAKDNSRPFVVAAGNVRVRAVGTAFSVRRRDDGVEVLVTEGVVESWIADAQGKVQRVAAGLKIFIPATGGLSQPIEASSEIQRRLAWRSGEIVLDGETVAEAAAEFNRYNAQQLTVDSKFANRRFDGWFRVHEPQVFARAVAASLGAKIIESRQEIHLAQ